MWCECKVQLEETGVAHHLGREFTRHRRQPGGRSEHHRLIAGLVVSVVQWALTELRNYLGTAIQKAHYRRDMKDVLIESGKEKRAVAVDGATEGEAELLLLR